MKVIVLGATYQGIAAACALARAGYKVTLIDEHTYPGGDITASQHTRVVCGENGFALDEPNGRRKMMLHARLCDAGVQVLYMARCAGIAVDSGRPCGAVVALKYGVKILSADGIIDATESGVGAFHLTGQRAVPYEAEFGYDIDQVEAVMESVVRMPESLGLQDDRVIMMPAMRFNTANVSFRFPVRPEEAMDRMAIERRAHELVIKTCCELRKKQCLAQAKVLLTGSHTRLYYRSVPRDERMPYLALELTGEFSLTEREQIESCAADQALRFAESFEAGKKPGCIMSAGQEIAGWSLGEADELGLRALIFEAEAQSFKKLHTDALIAGAGTGGAMAGWALRRHEADTLLVDVNYFCGGTNTVGKVYSAWHGYVDGMFAERARMVGGMPESEVLAGGLCAMMMWERLFSSGNTRMMGGVTVCGAVREGKRIKAALLCGEDGFTLAYGRFMIDGTADGDLCALAGIPFEVGGGRDGFVQTSSMWGCDYNRHKVFATNQYHMDQDVIDPDSYQDLLRGIGLGYRGNSEYEIVEMCMQRESRRFACRKGLTMAGIARRETHPDDIAVALCIHDTHGRPSSLMNTLGLFSARMMEPGQKDIRVRMPLGMFLPEDLDNTAIVGKSMCGEREAVALCRMNPDISNAGYAVGCAAAYAIEQNVDALIRVELAPVQEELRTVRVLPDWAAGPGDELGISEAIRALDDEADGGFAAMVQPKEEIVPFLREALADGGIRALNAAMALAWHGEKDGTALLLDQLEKEMERDIATLRQAGEFDVIGVRADGFERTVNPNDTYGYVEVGVNDPDFSYGRINRLLALIGLAGGKGIEAVLTVLKAAQAGWRLTGKMPYVRSRIDTHRFAYEGRLFALAAAAERLADRRACCELERLMDDQAIAGQMDNDRSGNVTPPQCTLCEIALARAALHCGSAKGARRLAGYLSSPRIIFRKMAHKALMETLPGGPAADEALWKAYIDGMDELPALPWRGDPYCG